MADIEKLKIIKESVKSADDKKINYWVEKFKKQLKGYVQKVCGIYIFKPFIYRIRRHTPSNMNLIKMENYSYFSSSSMFWCPKNQLCARVNLPFERRLYFSSTIETAMSECTIHNGEEFTLTKIRPKDGATWYSLKPILLGFMEYEKYYPEFYAEEQKILKYKPILSKFLSVSFIENTDHSGYCFTQLIASMIFTIPEMKCIIYPSTQNPYSGGFNVAYKVDDAEKDLEFEWAKVCTCKEGNKYDVLYKYKELTQPPF